MFQCGRLCGDSAVVIMDSIGDTDPNRPSIAWMIARVVQSPRRWLEKLSPPSESRTCTCQKKCPGFRARKSPLAKLGGGPIVGKPQRYRNEEQSASFQPKKRKIIVPEKVSMRSASYAAPEREK